eukprot:scaffold27853_cov14-Tisochrysis_lutea.AAC.1
MSRMPRLPHLPLCAHIRRGVEAAAPWRAYPQADVRAASRAAAELVRSGRFAALQRARDRWA